MQPGLTAVTVVALSAALLTAGGVGPMRRWCFRHGLIDIPNERSSHSRPIPRGGGLVIVAVVLTGLAIGVWLSSISQSVLGGWLGAALVAAVSWIDDLRSLPVRARLAAQGLAVALVLACGASPAWLAPLVGNVTLGWAWPVLSCFVLVGLTNAYNFMDGVDGIAAGQAVVAGIAWAIAGVHLGYPFAGWAGSLIAGASAGFLVHNWPPARIFMGDVGSGTLGFLFAWLAVESGTRDPRLPVAGLVFVWPFIFDTAFTFLRRLIRRENVFRAHRSHLYQRLVIAGLSHGVVSAIYGSLAVVGACLALSWLYGVSNAGAGLLIALPSAGVGLVATVLWKEHHMSHDPELPRVSS